MVKRIIVVDTQAELDDLYSADVQRADAVVVLGDTWDDGNDKLERLYDSITAWFRP